MKLVILMMLAVSITACKQKPETPKEPSPHEAFQLMLETSGDKYDRMNNGYSATNGYIVFQNKTTGEYNAYNISKFDQKSMKNYSDYTAVLGENDIVSNLKANWNSWENSYWKDEYRTNRGSENYYDDGCSCTRTRTWEEEVYVGQTWVTEWEESVTFSGGGMHFSNTGTPSKDLETLAALKEEDALRGLSDKFKLSLNLSETRSQELGKLYYRWQKLESKRELTESEKSFFATEALGVSYKDAESAIAKKILGDDKDYNELLETAADVNRTTPEKMGQFLEELTL